MLAPFLRCDQQQNCGSHPLPWIGGGVTTTPYLPTVQPYQYPYGTWMGTGGGSSTISISNVPGYQNTCTSGMMSVNGPVGGSANTCEAGSSYLMSIGSNTTGFAINDSQATYTSAAQIMSNLPQEEPKK